MPPFHPRPLALAAALIALAACSDDQPLAPERSASAGGTAAAPTVIQGEAGPGALYEIHVPASWNGELVLYAHGFRDTHLPVTLNNQDNFFTVRDALVAQGFAFAYSSYSENGFAFKDAAQRTHQLRGIFSEVVGEPSRVFLTGHSLGAVAILMLAERYPAQYAGALPMCGQVGGTQAAVDYVGHARVLFDRFYPDALPGNLFDLGGITPAQAVGAAYLAMATRPQGIDSIARVMFGLGTRLPGSPSLHAHSIAAVIGYNYRAMPDVLDRTHGHSPFDNTTTVYGAGIYDATTVDGINATADRFSATPDARNYLSNYYQPTGTIHIPVLTLFTPEDPVSPPFHEQSFRTRVAEAGRSDLLVQRPGALPYGHCAFHPSEMVQAFLDLRRWVVDGVKPTA